MKITVLGGGLMGTSILHDFIHHQDYSEIQVIEKNEEQIERLWKRFPNQDNLSFLQIDITDEERLEEAILGSSIVVSALPYDYNLFLLELAIKLGAHFMDLGGNEEILNQQLKLSEKVKKQNLIAFPACGLAPGLVSILAADGMRKLDTVHSVKLYCGGLPQNPRPPLNYQIVFSPHGLINEYLEPVKLIENGKIVEKPALTELEHLDFDPPYGQMEAFLTSGGAGTLIHSQKNRVPNLFYKTVRFSGHGEKIKFLFDLGFDSEEKLLIADCEITPRQMLEKLLEIKLTSRNPDAVLTRVIVDGKKVNQNRTFIYEMIDVMDAGTNLTAMMRTTGFSAAIVAQLIAENKINHFGVLTLESAIPTTEFLTELNKRGITVSVKES